LRVHLAAGTLAALDAHRALVVDGSS